MPSLLPFAPVLELRNVLMIEDEAFLLEGIGERLFGNGEEVLKLDETDAPPMVYWCVIRGSVLEVDVRFDTSVVRGEEMDSRLLWTPSRRNLSMFSHGAQDRHIGEILPQSSECCE